MEKNWCWWVNTFGSVYIYIKESDPEEADFEYTLEECELAVYLFDEVFCEFDYQSVRPLRDKIPQLTKQIYDLL